MILLDTNVLVALVDERDGLRTRAMSDLAKLKGPYGILDAVLVETHFMLEEAYLRQRVRFMLSRLAVQHVQVQPAWWTAIFDWLEKYAQHEPDLCDAMLAIVATHEQQAIWTYDQEFRKLWRGPGGRSLSLAGSTAKTRKPKAQK